MAGVAVYGPDDRAGADCRQESMANLTPDLPGRAGAQRLRSAGRSDGASDAASILAVVDTLYAQLHRGQPCPAHLGTASALERDLGFDSLARLELARRLEERMGVTAAPAAFAPSCTLGDLLRACGVETDSVQLARARQGAGRYTDAETKWGCDVRTDDRDASAGIWGCAARIIYSVYAALVLATIGALAFLVSLLVPGRRRAWTVTHLAARWALRLCAIRLRVNPMASNSGRPHVIVVNHCSYVDAIVVLAMLPAPHRFVATRWLARVPILGTWLRKLGAVFIERTEPIASGGAKARPVLDMTRDSLVVFPEGTFTAATGLRAFHLGAFKMAVAGKLAVIPVALRGTRRVLRDGQWLLRRCPVTVTVGAPIAAPSEGTAFASAVQLRDASRDFILRHCGEPDLM